jgi:hypothetical protein
MLKLVTLNFQDGVPLNLKKKNIRTLTVKKDLSIDTTFDPSQFSMDYTFKTV